MRTIEPRDEAEVAELLAHLNFCHDASMRRICFVKQRHLDKEDGSLVYPVRDQEELINCDIEVELLLNSYQGARTDQTVLLEFGNATQFRFAQSGSVDYSDVFQLEFNVTAEGRLLFVFLSASGRVRSLEVLCERVACKEL